MTPVTRLPFLIMCYVLLTRFELGDGEGVEVDPRLQSKAKRSLERTNVDW